MFFLNRFYKLTESEANTYGNPLPDDYRVSNRRVCHDVYMELPVWAKRGIPVKQYSPAQLRRIEQLKQNIEDEL